MSQVNISTVTPIYNGSKYIESLVGELDDFRNYLLKTFSNIRLVESIFVIDECIDNSDELLSKLSEKYSWVNVITLSRNYGQHPATIAGIMYSTGDWVVTLDEDLQHHPKFILNLLKEVSNNNFDVCYANAKNNVHKSVIKDTLAIYFKKITSYLLDNKNIIYFNSYRVMRGDIARATAAICRHETYFDVALSWFTKRVGFLKLDLVDERNQSGEEKSGYSFLGLIKHSKRMVMSSKMKILRSGILIGILAFLTSIGLSVYAFVSTFFDINTIVTKGWASTILVILFFSGLISLLVGFILESVSELLMSANGKPTFFVIDRSKDIILQKTLSSINNADL